jgi:elongation factor 2
MHTVASSIMGEPSQIRNVAIVGAANHGKTTIFRHLSTIAPNDGHHHPYRCFTNLLDTPGHLDLFNEVANSLRVSDGCLIVIDCMDGCNHQTENLIRQILSEKVKPLIIINKLDKCIFNMTYEDIYLKLKQIIDQVNLIISSYGEYQFQVSPETGTVSFGSGTYGWAFNLPDLGKFYADMTRRLWGDNFYDLETKSWSEQEGLGTVRGFCHFVLDPIRRSTLGNDGSEERKEQPLLLCNALAMMPCIIKMIITHLPSPVEAQLYRCEVLYEGPQDDDCAKAIKACDPKGPLVMYVSKLVRSEDTGFFYAVARVFSGTVYPGKNVRIQGPRYMQGSNDDLYVKNIEGVVLINGDTLEENILAAVSCGNICGLIGIDQYVNKTCTITDLKDSYNIRQVKYSMPSILRVSVRPRKGEDLPVLVDGLKMLSKSDLYSAVECIEESSGEYFIDAPGEIPLEIAINELRKNYAAGIEILISDPRFSYREAVLEESYDFALAKSPNRTTRLYMKAEPLGENLTREIEAGSNITATMDAKCRAKILEEKFCWSIDDAMKIWSFGHRDTCNVVVDATKGVNLMSEIKYSNGLPLKVLYAMKKCVVFVSIFWTPL